MATARKLPSGNYRVRVYDKNAKKYISFTAETKKEAERLASEWQFGKIIKSEAVTIRDRAEEYIRIRSNRLSPATVDKYREHLDQQLSKSFLSIRLDRLTDKDIIKEVNDLAGRYAPKTIRNAMNFILPIIRDDRPDLAKHIDLPKIQKPMKQYPRAEEIIELFRGDRFELEVLLALCCSLRKEEIRGLKPEDLSEDTITINRVKITIDGQDIVKDEAKTIESRRRIRLPAFILELFRQRQGAWISPDTYAALYGHYHKRMIKAGFKGITFHDLRHINASEMLALKVPDKYAMERGGWSTDHILKSVYQATFSEERIRYDTLIDNHFSKIYATKYDTEHISSKRKLAQIRYFKRIK